MGSSQSSMFAVKVKATTSTPPENEDLSKIDQDDLPLAENKYQKWRKEYIRPWNDLTYVFYNARKEADEKDAVTCSEAIGYGMLISVLMRNQQDFDGLLRWFLHFKNKKGLLSWQQVTDKRNNGFRNNPNGGDDSATDGDIDIATSLFYAAHVWGKSASGEQDYRQIAIALCKSIWDHTINQTTFMPLLGDWSENDKKFLDVTRPSDFILAGFSTFQNEDTERSQQWAKVIDATVTTLQHQLTLYPTGLIADFMKRTSKGYYEPVTKRVLESNNDKDYNWNSCRVPWRLSVYYLLTKDERVSPLLAAQSKFFGSLKQINAGYKLNGKRISDRNYCDKAFTAPASVAMWTTKVPALVRVLKEMQDLDSDTSYYGDSIQMLCLLQARNPRGY